MAQVAGGMVSLVVHSTADFAKRFEHVYGSTSAVGILVRTIPGSVRTQNKIAQYHVGNIPYPKSTKLPNILSLHKRLLFSPEAGLSRYGPHIRLDLGRGNPGAHHPGQI